MVGKIKINDTGDCIFTEQDTLDLIYTNPEFDISKLFFDDPKQFNASVKELGLDYPLLSTVPTRPQANEFDKKNIANWYMPQKYNDLNVLEWLLDKCTSDEEKKTVETQLNNFAVIVNNINNSKIDKDAKTPSLDQVYDLYQIGSLNTAQYNAILEFYHNEDKVEDQDMLDLINVQIVAAATVKDLDDIQAALNGDKGILDKVSPSNVVEFNNIIEKYRRDTGKFNDYKLYSEKLKLDVKDVGGLIETNATAAAKTKIKSIDALQEYNKFINENYSPQDAYLKVISKFTEKDLPKPSKLPMPAGLKLVDMKQTINKNPDEAQNKFENDLAKAYKAGTINMQEYKEGIKRLDFIFDVFEVRKNIIGEDKDKQGNLKYLGDLGKIKKTEDKKEDESIGSKLLNSAKELGSDIGGMFKSD